MWLQVTRKVSGIEFHWGNADGTFDYYVVPTETLDQMAGRLRQALADLAEAYRVGEPTADRTRALLQKVADAGARTTYVIFDREGDDHVPGEVAQWIEDQLADGDNELVITLDKTINIPWGCLFGMGENEALAAEDELKMDERFWWYKFRLRFQAFLRTNKNSARTSETNGTALLSACNREARDGLDHEFDIWDGSQMGSTFSYESCRELARDASGKDTLFHFFGHAEGDTLQVDNDDHIDVVSFKQLLDLLRGQKSTTRLLVFLNACSSADGVLDYSFRTSALRSGMCGFIGTEAIIPTKYAAMFGKRIADMVVTNQTPVTEALDNLRNDDELWPLSIFYSYYGAKNLHFPTPPERKS